MKLGYFVLDVGEPEFANAGSLAYKTFYYFIAVTANRMMYYVPWKFANASSIACGLGYNGIQSKDGQKVHKWDKIECADSFGCELGTAVPKMWHDWNHQIHLWLKFYVQ